MILQSTIRALLSSVVVVGAALHEKHPTTTLRNNHNSFSSNSKNENKDSPEGSPRDSTNDETGGASSDPFVPQKLQARHGHEHTASNKRDGSLLLSDLRKRVGRASRNQQSKKLRNQSVVYEMNKLSSEDRGQAESEAFDASQELGILDSNTIHHDEEQVDTKRNLQDPCDGNRPKVDPIVSFHAIIKRCLYYKDNCAYRGDNGVLPLECWDTSEVTDMSYAFYKLKNFNENVNTWDVSKVTDFSDMFGFAEAFDQPLDSWKTTSAIDMSDMFWGAKGKLFLVCCLFYRDSTLNGLGAIIVYNRRFQRLSPTHYHSLHPILVSNVLSHPSSPAFNQPINSWATSTVNDTYGMFLDAQAFNQPLDNWDFSSVKDSRRMFTFAYSFDQPLNSWNMGGVEDMELMFAYAKSFNQTIDLWNTASVTNMKLMFNGAESFNQNTDAWDTTSVTNMEYMFNKATNFNQCLSTWAYKNPTTLTGPLIFNGTDCPVKGIPDTTTGPWCRGAYDQCYPATTYVPASLSESSSANSLFGWHLPCAVLSSILIPVLSM